MSNPQQYPPHPQNGYGNGYGQGEDPAAQYQQYPPYGGPQQPQYPVYVQAPPSGNGKSVASLVLGLVSIFLGFTFFVPIIGLILGIIGARTEPAGRGMSVAGIILNSIMLLGWVIAGIIVIAALIGVFGVAATTAYSYSAA